MPDFAVDPVNLIRSLSTALELAVDGINMHHWGVAVICRHIAQEMKMPVKEQQAVLCAALLHDIGARNDQEERLRALDPFREGMEPGALFAHAEEGYNLLKHSMCFHSLAESVRYHHDNWAGGNPSGLSGTRIPLSSRIIHLADMVEVTVRHAGDAWVEKENIRASVARCSGKSLEPSLVEAFMRCSEKDIFWLDLMGKRYGDWLFKYLEGWGPSHFTVPEIVNTAMLFADIIDRMSTFTARHSSSVAEVAVLLAGHLGFDKKKLYRIRIAGLLHDLGKLSVSNDILEKPGRLSDQEMRLMRQHVYYTCRILGAMEGFEDIACWAGQHHETLDGQGYPSRAESREMPLGSRIMAVADIFVAMAEDRPYRSGMRAWEIYRNLYGMVEKGKVDSIAVEALLDLYEDAVNLVRDTGLHGMAGRAQHMRDNGYIVQ